MSKKSYIFFIGTVAEFIKLLPVIKSFKEMGAPYGIVASGQNNIQESEIFSYLKLEKPELILSNGPKNKTVFSAFLWFIKTFTLSLAKIHRHVRVRGFKSVDVIVHGDTLSTLMGAYIFKILGSRVIHVEAGLRSFNIFHPFPEEISRVLVSLVADVHFCPNEWAMSNIKNKKAIKVNTYNNTLLESLELAKKVASTTGIAKLQNKKPFFIFIIHRQENLYNVSKLQYFLDTAAKLSQTMHCVFILHEPTRAVLVRKGLLDAVINNKNTTVMPRQNYFDFMKMLEYSEFIITDGGSNQEESYYLGKPCLILRDHTERVEGLGENVVMWSNGKNNITDFAKNYEHYSRKQIKYVIPPSKIICEKLMNEK